MRSRLPQLATVSRAILMRYHTAKRTFDAPTARAIIHKRLRSKRAIAQMVKPAYSFPEQLVDTMRGPGIRARRREARRAKTVLKVVGAAGAGAVVALERERRKTAKRARGKKRS